MLFGSLLHAKLIKLYRGDIVSDIVGFRVVIERVGCLWGTRIGSLPFSGESLRGFR
jgi:hypothetical protein